VAVVGLQFGDEGKGQVVDRLAPRDGIVVRFNGGANAGHSVRVGEERYALHQLPSGVLTPGVLGVIAHGAVVDLDGLFEEIDALAARGIRVEERLVVSDRAHLVMPWHLVEDRIRGGTLGTTGRGIGPCYADRAARDVAFRVADLFEAPALGGRLAAAVDLKNALLGALAAHRGEPFTPLDPGEIAAFCRRAADRLRPLVADTTALLSDAAAAGRGLLWEGAHALLIDVDHGTYPYVTSSPCTARGTGATRVVGVAKAYMSRVGLGPFPTEIDGPEAEELRRRGNEYGTTTGRPRRVGRLDLVALRHAVRAAGATEIALTGLGVLAGLDRIRIAEAYRLDGTETADFPPTAAALERAEPVYEDLPGFEGDLASARSWEDLPTRARELVARIEATTAPVRHVAVGPKREQLIGCRMGT
jgi:adenylosuccinate synthase